MAWPFPDKPNSNPAEAKPTSEGGDPPKVVEKSPAEVIAESLRPLTDKLDAISQRIDQVEQSTRKPVPKAEPTAVTSVLEDEDAAFSQRMTPLMLRTLELEARMVRDQIEREYTTAGFGDLWSQFRPQIEGALNGSQLVTPDGQGGAKPLRGDPEYIRNVVDMIFGRAARTAGMRFDGKNKTFFLESAGGGEGAGPKPEADGLTPEQRKVFNRMGVPLEEAKKSLAKLKFVS
jgi:hypothetical protein